MVDLTAAAEELLGAQRQADQAVGFFAGPGQRSAPSASTHRRGHRGRAVLIAGSAVAAYELPTRASRQTVTAIGPSSTAPPTYVIPRGYHRVKYNNASIAAPAAWRVIQPGIHECPTPDNGQVVLLGDADTTRACGGTRQEPLTSYARLTSLPAGRTSAAIPVVINGHRGTEFSAGPGTRSYLFRDLRVELTVAGPDGASIAGTLEWSGAYLLLHPTRPVQIPKRWHEVHFEGVTLRVPPGWPIIDLGPKQYMPGICGKPEFPTPALDEGPGGPTPCRGLGVVSFAQTDGVWVRSHPETVEFSPTPHVTKCSPRPVRCSCAANRSPSSSPPL